MEDLTRALAPARGSPLRRLRLSRRSVPEVTQRVAREAQASRRHPSRARSPGWSRGAGAPAPCWRARATAPRIGKRVGRKLSSIPFGRRSSFSTPASRQARCRSTTCGSSTSCGSGPKRATGSAPPIASFWHPSKARRSSDTAQAAPAVHARHSRGTAPAAQRDVRRPVAFLCAAAFPHRPAAPPAASSSICSSPGRCRPRGTARLPLVASRCPRRRCPGRAAEVKAAPSASSICITVEPLLRRADRRMFSGQVAGKRGRAATRAQPGPRN